MPIFSKLKKSLQKAYKLNISTVMEDLDPSHEQYSFDFTYPTLTCNNGSFDLYEASSGTSTTARKSPYFVALTDNNHTPIPNGFDYFIQNQDGTFSVNEDYNIDNMFGVHFYNKPLYFEPVSIISGPKSQPLFKKRTNTITTKADVKAILNTNTQTIEYAYFEKGNNASLEPVDFVSHGSDDSSIDSLNTAQVFDRNHIYAAYHLETGSDNSTISVLYNFLTPVEYVENNQDKISFYTTINGTNTKVCDCVMTIEEGTSRKFFNSVVYATQQWSGLRFYNSIAFEDGFDENGEPVFKYTKILSDVDTSDNSGCPNTTKSVKYSDIKIEGSVKSSVIRLRKEGNSFINEGSGAEVMRIYPVYLNTDNKYYVETRVPSKIRKRSGIVKVRSAISKIMIAIAHKDGDNIVYHSDSYFGIFTDTDGQTKVYGINGAYGGFDSDTMTIRASNDKLVEIFKIGGGSNTSDDWEFYKKDSDGSFSMIGKMVPVSLNNVYVQRYFEPKQGFNGGNLMSSQYRGVYFGTDGWYAVEPASTVEKDIIEDNISFSGTVELMPQGSDQKCVLEVEDDTIRKISYYTKEDNTWILSTDSYTGLNKGNSNVVIGDTFERGEEYSFDNIVNLDILTESNFIRTVSFYDKSNSERLCLTLKVDSEGKIKESSDSIQYATYMTDGSIDIDYDDLQKVTKNTFSDIYSGEELNKKANHVMKKYIKTNVVVNGDNIEFRINSSSSTPDCTIITQEDSSSNKRYITDIEYSPTGDITNSGGNIILDYIDNRFDREAFLERFVVDNEMRDIVDNPNIGGGIDDYQKVLYEPGYKSTEPRQAISTSTYKSAWYYEYCYRYRSINILETSGSAKIYRPFSIGDEINLSEYAIGELFASCCYIMRYLQLTANHIGNDSFFDNDKLKGLYTTTVYLKHDGHSAYTITLDKDNKVNAKTPETYNYSEYKDLSKSIFSGLDSVSRAGFLKKTKTVTSAIKTALFGESTLKGANQASVTKNISQMFMSGVEMGDTFDSNGLYQANWPIKINSTQINPTRLWFKDDTDTACVVDVERQNNDENYKITNIQYCYGYNGLKKRTTQESSQRSPLSINSVINLGFITQTAVLTLRVNNSVNNIQSNPLSLITNANEPKTLATTVQVSSFSNIQQMNGVTTNQHLKSYRIRQIDRKGIILKSNTNVNSTQFFSVGRCLKLYTLPITIGDDKETVKEDMTILANGIAAARRNIAYPKTSDVNEVDIDYTYEPGYHDMYMNITATKQISSDGSDFMDMEITLDNAMTGNVYNGVVGVKPTVNSDDNEFMCAIVDSSVDSYNNLKTRRVLYTPSYKETKYGEYSGTTLEQGESSYYKYVENNVTKYAWLGERYEHGVKVSEYFYNDNKDIIAQSERGTDGNGNTIWIKPQGFDVVNDTNNIQQYVEFKDKEISLTVSDGYGSDFNTTINADYALQASGIIEGEGNDDRIYINEDVESNTDSKYEYYLFLYKKNLTQSDLNGFDSLVEGGTNYPFDYYSYNNGNDSWKYDGGLWKNSGFANKMQDLYTIDLSNIDSYPGFITRITGPYWTPQRVSVNSRFDNYAMKSLTMAKDNIGVSGTNTYIPSVSVSYGQQANKPLLGVITRTDSVSTGVDWDINEYNVELSKKGINNLQFFFLGVRDGNVRSVSPIIDYSRIRVEKSFNVFTMDGFGSDNITYVHNTDFYLDINSNRVNKTYNYQSKKYYEKVNGEYVRLDMETAPSDWSSAIGKYYVATYPTYVYIMPQRPLSDEHFTDGSVYDIEDCPYLFNYAFGLTSVVVTRNEDENGEPTGNSFNEKYTFSPLFETVVSRNLNDTECGCEIVHLLITDRKNQNSPIFTRKAKALKVDLSNQMDKIESWNSFQITDITGVTKHCQAGSFASVCEISEAEYNNIGADFCSANPIPLLDLYNGGFIVQNSNGTVSTYNY